MDIKELKGFYLALEDIVTYNKNDYDENLFYNNLNSLKKCLVKYNVDIPNELKKSKTKHDLRHEFQKIGGYEKRRDRLKEIIYPLIDNMENNMNVETKVYSKEMDISKYLKENNFEINTRMGCIKNVSLECKCGANGKVYFGELNKHDVAIKILTNSTAEKKERFLREFINVIMEINNFEGIVKQYFYDDIIINEARVPIIVMKKYNNSLIYKEKFSDDEIILIFTQIINAVKKLHSSGIIHRDLKPNNILIDENNRLNIADFGIAYYNPDNFDINIKTQKGDRLANFDFSAPEQRDRKKTPTEASDIFSIGQIMQWIVYNEPHKGTHRKPITDKYKGIRMEFLDKIIDKCLINDQNERYQSIEQIEEDIKRFKESKKVNEEIIVDKKITNKEIKEQLTDIMNNIVYYEKTDRFGNSELDVRFQISYELSEINVQELIENIPYKLDKLLFNDQVKMSYFLDGVTVFSEVEIEKCYFEYLYNLYSLVKDNTKLLIPFINYIKNIINENCVEIIF